MRAFAFALGALALTLAPSPASAVTVDQVVALTKAGVSDTIILAYIDRDKTILALDANQIVALTRDGVSEAVLIAMLKSGREEGEAAVRAESAVREAWMNFSLLSQDGLLVDTAPIPYAVPYDVPFAPIDNFYAPPMYPTPRLVPQQNRRAAASRRVEQRVEPPVMCYAQVRSGPVATQSGLTYLTECPAVMQPRRKSLR